MYNSYFAQFCHISNYSLIQGLELELKVFKVESNSNIRS